MMTENFGRCALCGGDKQPGTTTFTVDLTSSLVVVRGVPELVCTICEEAWIEDPVAAKLETIVDDARLRRVVVEVTPWPDVA